MNWLSGTMHRLSITAERPWQHFPEVPQVSSVRKTYYRPHTHLKPFPFRYPRSDWYSGIRLLWLVCHRTLGHDPGQVRIELAKVFHQSTEPADHRVPSWHVHIRALLDVPLRDGSCILRGHKDFVSINGGCFDYIPIN